MSIFIRGKFLGSRHREFNQGAVSFYEIGVENLRPDGWGGTQSVQVAVRIPKKLVDGGFLNGVANFIGKNVEIPVWLDAYVGKNGPSVNFFLESDDIQTLK